MLFVQRLTRVFGSQNDSLAPWLLAATAAAMLAGCGEPIALTIHNGYDHTIQVEGLASGQATIHAGELARFEGIETRLALVARDDKGKELERAEIELPGQGGESLWNAGGGACFVLGDFSAYYSSMTAVPAAAQVLAIIKGSDRTWTSQGPIAAGPGQRLPKNLKATRVAALVEVPCNAAVSEPIARGWLEMTLPKLQP